MKNNAAYPPFAHEFHNSIRRSPGKQGHHLSREGDENAGLGGIQTEMATKLLQKFGSSGYKSGVGMFI